MKPLQLPFQLRKAVEEGATSRSGTQGFVRLRISASSRHANSMKRPIQK
jgi:hypothetical protein